ncbi:L-galactose dehydrogenase-like [Teleopsis dalmanni]|uniref:L-galactose dehydrogenase-like n=1 Tax=Teleopsis dalmanni TaxID=139649 RepID=UPI0018CD2F9C|nr:L-galactose dehydrogenase-like [Teleopsis dalmanni]
MSNLPKTYVKEFHDEELCKRMEYNAMGKTGMMVSKLSFGCGTFSDFYGELDLDEAIKTVHKAIKTGINYIDTAPYYGQGRSEEVLGLALKEIPRQAYYIATKVGRYTKKYETMFDFSAKKTRESIYKSLELLGLDYIDVIQIHDIEFAKNLDVIVDECLPELEKIVREGKAKFIGVTGYPLDILRKCIERAPGRFDIVLSYARNTLMDDTLNSYVNFFQKEKVGLVCAAGHALGLLTNAGPQAWHPADDKQKQLCRKAANICKEANVELGKLAMYYCMQFNGATTFLTGMQTRTLLDINLSAFYDGITKKEQEILQMLCKDVFTKSTNWENIEVQRYWTIMNKNN